MTVNLYSTRNVVICLCRTALTSDNAMWHLRAILWTAAVAQTSLNPSNHVANSRAVEWGCSYLLDKGQQTAQAHKKTRVASHMVNRKASCGAHRILIKNWIKGKGQGQSSATIPHKMTWLDCNISPQLRLWRVWTHVMPCTHKTTTLKSTAVFPLVLHDLEVACTADWREKFGWEEVRLISIRWGAMSTKRRIKCFLGRLQKQQWTQQPRWSTSLTSSLSCCAF